MPVTENNTKKRSIWFLFHHWVGFNLNFMLSFVLLTGTLAVIANEIDWLLDSKKRAIPASHVKDKHSLGELVDIAQAAYPDWKIQLVYGPTTSWFAVNITAQDKTGKWRRIYVNPYTGKIQGDSNYLTVKRFLREIHRNLMLPTNVGIPIVTSLSFALLVSLISGLKIYKKFWRGFFKSPSHKNSRVWYGGFHRLLGLWSLPLIIITVLTSWWYLIENQGGGAANYRHIYSLENKHAGFVSFKQMQENAQLAYPELRITHLVANRGAARPVVFWGDAKANLVRPRANFVSVDPFTGDIIEIHKGEQINTHQWISEMSDPLHFGTWGRSFSDSGGILISKWLWFILGVILTGLSVTGTVIYVKRINKQLIQRNWFFGLRQKMGLWIYVNLFFILTAFIAWPFREY